MNSWQSYQREKQRCQQLMNDLQYRQSLREMDRSEKSLDQLSSRCAARAVEAHNAGNHALAVQLAGEAARLKKVQDLGDRMKTTVETVHTMQSAQRAMACVLSSTRAAAASRHHAADMTPGMQVDLALLQSQAQTLTDRCGMICEGLDDDMPEQNAEGLQYLQELLASSRRKRHTRVLHSTQNYLDRIPRHPQLENERNR